MKVPSKPEAVIIAEAACYYSKLVFPILPALLSPSPLPTGGPGFAQLYLPGQE